MSIAILNEVYNETRRLSIAGSNLANGDFRLQKLVEPLTKAGEKAPVFARVASAVEQVITSTDKTASDALMELSTLVTAVLYTQGATGTKGTLSPIEASNFDIPSTTASARTLIPLIDALTTTGSGRMEVIQEAHQRGAFQDVRLFKPALLALDDVYAEIADFVSDNVLPLYGKAIIPNIKNSLDLKGKRGHARRLVLLHRLDPEGVKPLVEEALESGSKEIKVAAISCLKGSEKHLTFILEQCKARIKDVRQAAFSALSSFKGAEVEKVLSKALSGSDAEMVAPFARTQTSPEFVDNLVTLSGKTLQALIAETDQTKQKKSIKQFYALLQAFQTREDKASEAFILDCFDQRATLEPIESNPTDGNAINTRIAQLMAQSNLKPLQQNLITEHESLNATSLYWSMATALRNLPAAEVFTHYAPYYTKKLTKRSSLAARTSQETIRDLLVRTSWKSHTRYNHYRHNDIAGFEDIKLDDQWLSAAVAQKDINLVVALAQKQHVAAVDFLYGTLKARAGKTNFGKYEDYGILGTLIRIGHPEATDFYTTMLKKSSKLRRYGVDWQLFEMMSDLPVAAVAEIEKTIPELPERYIEHIIPFLEELKAK